MTVKTLLGIFRQRRFRLMLGTMKRIGDFYRLSWLASAARQGVLRALAERPLPFDRLAKEFSPDPRTQDALRAWLQVGVRLGELESGPAGFALRGFMARRLAEERHDPVSAFIEEVVQLHHSPSRWSSKRSTARCPAPVLFSSWRWGRARAPTSATPPSLAESNGRRAAFAAR